MTKPVVFLSAGEPSGDFLGSQVMKALKCQLDEQVTFTGIGGPLMEAEGLSSLFPMEELSVWGLAEIIPHIWRIRKRIHETVAYIEANQPDIVVTIDAPGFNFRVGKAFKKRLKTIPLVHYGAPSVWAWRPKRAYKVAQFLDHLLTLFPFEPPYFLKEGLPATFVGHPVIETGQEQDTSFRQRHGIAASTPLLTLLPGSRKNEISRLLPVFQQTALLLQNSIPDLKIVIPTLPHLKEDIQNQLTMPAILLTTPCEKFAAYHSSQAALAASGTVSLELAVAGLPMVIAYKVNYLTYWLLRLLVRVKYICLVNIFLNKEAVPERFQGRCTPETLAQELEPYFLNTSPNRREALLKDLQEVVRMLHPPALSGSLYPARYQQTPSHYAARVICQLMGKG